MGTPPSKELERAATPGRELQPTAPPRGGWDDDAVLGPPDRPSLSLSIARGWPLIALALLILVGTAIGIGLRRDPVFTAETRLNVGSVQGSAQRVPGYVAATQDLATAYSRVATSDSVTVPAARRLGTTPDEVTARLEVTPVPESPVLVIEGEGASEAEAVAVTEVVSRQLRQVVDRGESAAARESQLLREFRRWSRIAVALEQRLEQRRGQRRADPSAVSAQTLQDTKAAAEVARLRADGASGQYQAARQGDAESSGLTVLAQARTAASDRGTVLQRLIFVGVLGGLAIGVALAVLRTRRLGLSA